jgi:hypothetical protein
MNETWKLWLWTFFFWAALNLPAMVLGVWSSKTLISENGWGAYARINQVANATIIYVLILSWGDHVVGCVSCA